MIPVKIGFHGYSKEVAAEFVATSEYQQFERAMAGSGIQISMQVFDEVPVVRRLDIVFDVPKAIGPTAIEAWQVFKTWLCGFQAAAPIMIIEKEGDSLTQVVSRRGMTMSLTQVYDMMPAENHKMLGLLTGFSREGRRVNDGNPLRHAL